MDINNLLNKFLGSTTSTDQNSPSLAEQAKVLAQKATQGGVGSFAGGAVTGGLLTLLLNNHKAREIASGTLGYGGAALLGVLAHQAYQRYKTNTATEGTTNITPNTNRLNDQVPLQIRVEQDNQNFSLTLIKGMIAAAKSDGHIDSKEQQHILTEVDKMKLPPEQKAIVFEALMKPTDLQSLTQGINNLEQAAELYLASCIAIDPDHPGETEFLKSLANTLKLPSELVSEIHQQVKRL